MEDPYYFCREILNYNRFIPEPHKALTDFLTTSKRRTNLILMPRGSFKSSAITVGYSVWNILKNPNIRILISSETQRNAIKFVGEIKGHFESNLKFRGLYGDWVNRGGCWTQYEFVVRNRTVPKKEPTVMASSLEKGTSVGLHFDIIILDDVVSINNINSEDQIQKTIDHYKLLLSILEPNGKIFVVGTRWGHYELYSWLIDPDGPEIEMVDQFYRTAEDDKGNPTMPSILSKEFLDQQRKTQGTFIFNCQYLNKAESSELNTFRKVDIQFYEKSPTGLIYFMTVDPAISQSEHSDFSGIIVNGVDYYGNWFIQEALQLRVQPSELIALIMELGKKYQPLMCLGMEKFALEKVLKHSLMMEMDKQDFFLPVKDLQTSTKISKEARIRSLQPIVSQRLLHIKKEHQALYYQLCYHPVVKHDDVLDALKSQTQIVFPSGTKPEVEIISTLTDNEKAVWADLKNFQTRKVKRTSGWDYM